MEDGHDAARRAELSRFLRARRARISPGEAGILLSGRRRTPGLRREEVAEQAGVGVSWYTWLEQGRPITASAQVLDSLARVLQLDTAERAHLFILARGEQPVPPIPATDAVGPAVQLILDALGAAPAYFPAYVVNAYWDAVAWNEIACRVFMDFAALPPRERNLLRFMFTKPLARRLYADWEGTARYTLALFRASTGRVVGETWLAALVSDLAAASPEFAAWWSQGDVRGVPHTGKELDHPLVGRLALQATPLQIGQAPDQWMIVESPVPGTDTPARLERLMAEVTAAQPV
jgi:transcriptional regulator with XRE-family HTH domain